jgi:hypothetical protein
MAKVQLKEGLAEKYPQSVTLVNGTKAVAIIGGPITREIPGDGVKPPQTRVIPAATQAELQLLFKEGHPFLEEVETNDVKGKE